MIKKLSIIAFLITVMMFEPLSPTLATEYGDIYMDSKQASMKKSGVKPVQFPHWFHRVRYKCKVCHESIFKMKQGANDISMKKIMDGKACGTCHNGLIAWEPLYCDRCHSAEPRPAAGSPEARK